MFVTSNRNGFLRPHRQPIYDSEYVDGAINRIDFFVTTAGQPFASSIASRRTKTKGDSYPLEEAEVRGKKALVLPIPHEFSLLGFTLLIDPTASDDDRNQVIKDGFFSFDSCTGRPFMESALAIIPDVRMEVKQFFEVQAELYLALKAELKSMGRELTEEEEKKWEDKFSAVWPRLRCDIARAALKFKSGEALSAFIEWPVPPRVSKPVKLTLMLSGLYWKAIE